MKYNPITLTALLGLSLLIGGSTKEIDAKSHKDFNVFSSYKISGISIDNLQKIAKNYEVHDKIGEDSFEVNVPKLEIEDFLELAPNAELLEDDIDAWMKSPNLNRDGYRDFNEVQNVLKGLADKHDFVTYHTYGKSGRGRDLFYIKISDQDAVTYSGDKEPIIEMDAATHGDEWITTEATLRHIETLVKQYADGDSRVRNIFDNSEVVYIPIVSPDSFQRSRNVNGLDPNRSFPGLDGRGNPQKPKGRLPAIDGLISKIYDGLNPVATLNWHGAPQQGMIMYAWGYSKGKYPEAKHHPHFKGAASKMNAEVSGTKYRTGTIADVIYAASNSSADYVYLKRNSQVGKNSDSRSYALAIEFSGGQKKPPVSRIDHYTKETFGIALAYLEYFSKNKFDKDLNPIQ